MRPPQGFEALTVADLTENFVTIKGFLSRVGLSKSVSV